MEKLTHEEKHKQCMKEIRATVIAGVICCLWHVITAFALNGNGKTVFGIPQWFFVSVFGESIIAIVCVIFLVKKVFKDFEYDEEGSNE